MRLSICATAIAATTLFQRCIAAPSFRSSSLESTLKARDGNTDGEASKYFHEPVQNVHYDIRYFSGVASDEERIDTQLHMVRAYFKFFNERGLDTWIAHGTLLGWWWNGKSLPWDPDLDAQVSNATLHHLGQSYNQTKYVYASADGNVRREYLLDVNPWIGERVKGNGMNVIDARWIDTRNGLYIDITGLSETRPDTHPNVWRCKNEHDYKVTDLYPMRETIFEGVPAKVPYEYDKILVDEYHASALVNTTFNEHYWDPTLKAWFKLEERAQRDKEAQEIRDMEAKQKILARKQLEWQASWP